MEDTIQVRESSGTDFTGGDRWRKGHYDPKEPYASKVVAGPSDLPEGGEWQAIQFDNRWELWPVPPSGYDPMERWKVLRHVDAAYQRTTPTEEHPTRRAVQMLVNEKFSDLFRTLRYWGDEPEIPVDRETNPEVMPQDRPAFRFIVEEPVDRYAPTVTGDVEIREIPSQNDIQKGLDDQNWQPTEPPTAATSPPVESK